MSDRIEKTEYEERWIYCDFNGKLPAGEAISTHAVIVTDKDGTDVSATIVPTATAVSGAKVMIRVEGGTAGADPYIIDVRAEASNGDKMQGRARLWIVG